MLKAKIDITTLTTEQVYKIIDDYRKSPQYERYFVAQSYYEGRHEILDRPSGSTNADVNNTLVNNFPGYIVDVNVGYFMGKPISYTSAQDDYDFLDALSSVFDYNDEQDKNMELGKTAAIKGRTYELLYVDEEALLRFCVIQPENLILVYSTLVEPEPVVAIRFWEVPDLFSDDVTLHATVYTDTEIIKYKGEGDDLSEESREQHPFQQVPVIEYPNNDERQGDFDKVITLIDAYDKAQSDVANDFESFADAFLLVRNMSGTDDQDISEMRKKRIILVDDDGDASWLVKDINDRAQENYKLRLQEDIHRFSLTPNLTDEKFAGTVTGIALQYKTWGLEQSASQKERKFKKSLQKRLELICNFLRVKGQDFDWRDISITFSRNAPPILKELVEIVTHLRDIVSDETLLALLPFIQDPREEQERLARQNEGQVDIDEFDPALPEEEDDLYAETQSEGESEE